MSEIIGIITGSGWYFIDTIELIKDNSWWIVPGILGLVIWYYYLYRGKYFKLIIKYNYLGSSNFEGWIFIILFLYFAFYTFVLSAAIASLIDFKIFAFLSFLILWGILLFINFTLNSLLFNLSIGFKKKYLLDNKIGQKLNRIKDRAKRNNEVYGFKYSGTTAFVIWLFLCLTFFTTVRAYQTNIIPFQSYDLLCESSGQYYPSETVYGNNNIELPIIHFPRNLKVNVNFFGTITFDKEFVPFDNDMYRKVFNSSLEDDWYKFSAMIDGTEMCHENYGCYYDKLEFSLESNRSAKVTKDGKTIFIPSMWVMYLNPDTIDVYYACKQIN